jgi:transposase
MARKTYNDEFRIAAAKLVRQQGYSLKKAAHSLGVDSASIRSWIRKFDPAPLATAADASPEELKREILRLKEENRRLLMEREISKKATAFFAREQS